VGQNYYESLQKGEREITPAKMLLKLPRFQFQKKEGRKVEFGPKTHTPAKAEPIIRV